MSDCFPVKVRKHGDRQVEIQLRPSMLVTELKRLVEQYFAVPPERQKLIAQGKVLRDSDTVAEARLQPGFVVQLLVTSPAPPPPPAPSREPEEVRPNGSM